MDHRFRWRPAWPSDMGRRAAGASAAVLMASIGIADRPASAAPADGWPAYRGAVHGFTIAYPAAVFAPIKEAPSTSEDNLALVSHDGRARLLAEAFWNGDGETLAAYRTRLLAEVYPGARLDYAPTRSTWFVVSGIKDRQMFYHRTSFTCGGRMISSWAMAYPVAERAMYDRIVEGIARRHTAGRGADGGCREPVAEATPAPAEAAPPGAAR